MEKIINIADLTRNWRAKVDPELNSGKTVLIKDGRTGEILYEIRSVKKKRYKEVKGWAEPLDLGLSQDLDDQEFWDSMRERK